MSPGVAGAWVVRGKDPGPVHHLGRRTGPGVGAKKKGL